MGADAELDGGKLLADGAEVGSLLGEEDAVAGPEELLVLPQSGFGRGESAVLSHGFLDDLGELRGFENLPPVSGNGVAVVKVLGLASRSDGLGGFPALGVLIHCGGLGTDEVGADGATGEEEGK